MTSSFRFWAAAIVTAFVATLSMPLSAMAGGTTDIEVGDDFFSPDDATNVRFVFGWDSSGDGTTEHLHSVVQDDRFFASGESTNTGTFDLLLPSAGSYHYFCAVHGSKSGGMDGVARKYIYFVPFKGEAGEWQTAYWSSDGEGTPKSYRFDVQWRVAGRKWKNWKKDTRNTEGKFGIDDKPVDVNPSLVYELRARTQIRNNEKRRSDWSPSASVEP